MKKRKLFTLALATMTFVACSNDDSLANGENQKGEIIDAISVKFVNPATKANGGVEAGLAQENKVYHAFVFAKEGAPTHAAARPGDFTVVEVGSANATDEIKPGSIDKHLGNMATFKNVRQGDNVYVLANCPNLDMAKAIGLARNGDKSEEKIKAFIDNVQKDYLYKLAFSSKKVGEDPAPAPSPTSKYMMAGMGTIPISPTIPNNTTVVVPVKLDREMAKVFFYANVATDPAKHDAAGKVAFKEDDGIIVTRITPKISPFIGQAPDWYFPSVATDQDKDWNASWLSPFDGNSMSAVDNKIAGTPIFNNAIHNEKAKEFRYTWCLNGTQPAAGSNAPYLYRNEGFIMSPYFYVTPNYSNAAGSATVVCTQATYVGAPQFKDQDAQILFVKAYGKYSASNQALFQTKPDDKGVAANAIKFGECVWTDAAMAQVNTYLATVNDLVKGEIAVLCGWPNDAIGKDLVTKGIAELAKLTKVVGITSNDPLVHPETGILEYYAGMKVYYRADIANYSDDNTISQKITERNTFYNMRATITTLGAKSIEDAINSDQINMKVAVTVNPWNVMINEINM